MSSSQYHYFALSTQYHIFKFGGIVSSDSHQLDLQSLTLLACQHALHIIQDLMAEDDRRDISKLLPLIVWTHVEC